MFQYVVVQVMDSSLYPVFKTNDSDEALAAREAAQHASHYKTVILWLPDADEEYETTLQDLGVDLE